MTNTHRDRLRAAGKLDPQATDSDDSRITRLQRALDAKDREIARLTVELQRAEARAEYAESILLSSNPNDHPAARRAQAAERALSEARREIGQYRDALHKARQALRNYSQMAEGFADAVRQDSGHAYPWESWQAAEMEVNGAMRAIIVALDHHQPADDSYEYTQTHAVRKQGPPEPEGEGWEEYDFERGDYQETAYWRRPRKPADQGEGDLARDQLRHTERADPSHTHIGGAPGYNAPSPIQQPAEQKIDPEQFEYSDGGVGDGKPRYAAQRQPADQGESVAEASLHALGPLTDGAVERDAAAARERRADQGESNSNFGSVCPICESTNAVVFNPEADWWQCQDCDAVWVDHVAHQSADQGDSGASRRKSAVRGRWGESGAGYTVVGPLDFKDSYFDCCTRARREAFEQGEGGADEARHLTPKEREVMHKALRSGTNTWKRKTNTWKCIPAESSDGEVAGYMVGHRGDVICHAEPNHSLKEQKQEMEKIAALLNNSTKPDCCTRTRCEAYEEAAEVLENKAIAIIASAKLKNARGDIESAVHAKSDERESNIWREAAADLRAKAQEESER